MACQTCNSSRIVWVSAKCSDMCGVRAQGVDQHGYAPYNMNVGGGDYIQLEFCMECGQLQGEWPVALEKDDDEDDEDL